jgi:hypothetical protein
MPVRHLSCEIRGVCRFVSIVNIHVKAEQELRDLRGVALSARVFPHRNPQQKIARRIRRIRNRDVSRDRKSAPRQYVVPSP